jgi:hypothetical protein
VSELALPNPERRAQLAKLIGAAIEGLETDALEFRRLVKSFQRRPQMVFLRELLRTGPARRTPENEIAWKGLRTSILAVLEKGEVQEAELPWFLAWAARVTNTRMPRMERTGPTDHVAPPDKSRWGERFDRTGMPPRGPDRGGPPGGRPGGPGGPGGRFGGGPPGRGRGPDRDRDRGGPVRMPQQPREVDTRWDLLKSFKVDEEKKEKK